jgi:hypothetical protein
VYDKKSAHGERHLATLDLSTGLALPPDVIPMEENSIPVSLKDKMVKTVGRTQALLSPQ